MALVYLEGTKDTMIAIGKLNDCPRMSGLLQSGEWRIVLTEDELTQLEKAIIAQQIADKLLGQSYSIGEFIARFI